MAVLEHDAPVTWLEDSDLRPAMRCLVKAWFADEPARPAMTDLEPACFGMLEPYLAEAAVLERGGDFLFQRWGAALGVLCGGDHLGHRLSVLPQPARSHLRRVSVRAAASRSPAVSTSTWVVEGEIWRCVMLALPSGGDEFAVSRLLVAL